MPVFSSFQELPSIPEKPVVATVSKRTAVRALSESVRRIFSDSQPPKKRELVAGGDIRWKPVDLAAAKLLMKSPAINKPQHMSKAILEEHRAFSTDNASQHAKNVEICSTLPDKAEQKTGRLVKLANDAAEAKALLDEITTTLTTEVSYFNDELPKAIKAVRAWRMAITQERDLAISALGDIRKFFLGADHEKEMARLENFIRTCERLRSLSQDGTLSKVADVMLKLI